MPAARFSAALCLCVLLASGCATISPEERETSFDEAVTLYDQQHYAEAYAIFNKLATVDAAAARNAAFMLRHGQGVARDQKAALLMYRFAAQAGLPTAEADLGEMLLLGEGGPPNPQAALPWLTLAAHAHHAIAEYHLGTLYESGTAVPKDLTKARELYEQAAAAGDKRAAARLAAMGGTAAAPAQAETEAPPAAEKPEAGVPGA
jgi:TPR repeat protein